MSYDNTTPELLVIKANNQSIFGWEGIRLTRGIERFPSDFQLSCSEKFPGQANSISVIPGSPCTITSNGDLLLTGYVDEYASELNSRANIIQIVGSSMCSDVHDSDAAFVPDAGKGATQTQKAFTNVGVMAQELCEPFGITLTSPDINDAALPAIPLYAINLGETVYQVIEQQARVAGLLVYDNPAGNLVLSKAGTNTHTGSVAQATQLLEAATGRFDMRSRFTEYDIFYQSIMSMSDTMPNSDKRGFATDPTFPKRADGKARYRPKFLMSEQVMLSNEVATKKATYIANRTWGRSQIASLTVSSWRDSAGLLWQPNYLLNIQAPAIKLENETWLISEVTYSLDAKSGITATLTLMPPDAFAVDTTPLQPFAPDIIQGIQKGSNPTSSLDLTAQVPQ